MDRSSPVPFAASLALIASLTACGPDPASALPDVVVGNDAVVGTDAVVGNDVVNPPSDTPPPPMDAPRPPPPDGAMPPPPDGAMPPPPDAPPPPRDGAMPPPDAPLPPTDVPAPQDVPLATDAGSPVDSGASCANPGTPRTVALNPTNTETSNFNVTPLACTRTALALQCALGVGSSVQITIEGTLRRIRANGIPNHDVGDFPNPGNPNAISAQSYNYTVPVTPSGAGARGQVFGIATSGVVLDPGTAEMWNNSMNWNYEAMRYATAPSYFSGATATDTTRHPTSLGVDCNFAHVQPNGAYHYHGIPMGMLPTTPALTFIGWAADGYPIYGRWDYSDPNNANSALREMRASYRLRSGTRPSGTAGPGGTYDGTFVQDWEYVAGAGDLDECNGRTGVVTLEGRTVTTYHYVLTNTYPYIPRCFRATPDASFARGMMMMGGGDAGVPPMGDGGTPPPADSGMTGPIACTSAAQCTNACPMGSRGCTCGSTPMGMRCVPTCTTNTDCPPGPMGMTLSCRSGVCAP